MQVRVANDRQHKSWHVRIGRATSTSTNSWQHYPRNICIGKETSAYRKQHWPGDISRSLPHQMWHVHINKAWIVKIDCGLSHQSIVFRNGIHASPFACTPCPDDVGCGLPKWYLAYTLLSRRRLWTSRIKRGLWTLLSPRRAWSLNITIFLQTTNNRYGL